MDDEDKDEETYEETSPSVAVMKHYGAPLTLDEWVGLNNLNIDAPLDAELFETLPERFHEEYRNRFFNFISNERGTQ
jgi:hypothetical protein